MNIDGLGDKIVDQLIEHDLVRDFADLYKLKLETIAGLERTREVLAEREEDDDPRRTYQFRGEPTGEVIFDDVRFAYEDDKPRRRN